MKTKIFVGRITRKNKPFVNNYDKIQQTIYAVEESTNQVLEFSIFHPLISEIEKFESGDVIEFEYYINLYTTWKGKVIKYNNITGFRLISKSLDKSLSL
jgi:hypothetical protein